MARILSIEVGNTITRICEMDYKVKNPKVYNSISINTPKGVLEDGFVKDNIEYTMAIKDALIQNNIKTKQVVFSITSNRIVTREVLLPAVKESQIGNMIKANANDYFPIDLTMYDIAHIPLGKTTGEDGSEKFRVLVMAAGKDLVQSYRKLASACGLKVTTVDYSGNSIFQIMREECGSGTELVIKLEENSTIATVISNHELTLQRQLAYGVDRAVEALVESSTFYENTYEDAMKAMCSRACIKVALNNRTKIVESGSASDSDSFAEEYQKITEGFAQLIGNLTRVIELHNLKEPQNQISRCTVVGLGSDIVDITKLFTNELGIRTEKLSSARTVAWSGARNGEGIGRYVTAMGAAIAPINLMGEETSKRSEKKAMDYGKVTIAIALASVLACAYFALPTLLKYNSETSRKKELDELNAKYTEGENLYKQFVAVEILNYQVERAGKRTVNNNDNIISLMNELEAKLPNDVKIAEFVSTDESCEITFTIPADDPLNEAAVIFQTLRKFSCFVDVNLGDMKNDGDTAGTAQENVLQFKAVCSYIPNVVSEEVPDFATIEEDKAKADRNKTAVAE